jgi:hypothetical protein
VTADSRMRALNRANVVRAKRSTLKADLRTGRIHLADVLLSDEGWLRSMRVRDLLLATPGVGKLKANRALQTCWVSGTAPLHCVSRKSREKVLEWLEEKHPAVSVGEWERAESVLPKRETK